MISTCLPKTQPGWASGLLWSKFFWQGKVRFTVIESKLMNLWVADAWLYAAIWSTVIIRVGAWCSEWINVSSKSRKRTFWVSSNFRLGTWWFYSSFWLIGWNFLAIFMVVKISQNAALIPWHSWCFLSLLNNFLRSPTKYLLGLSRTRFFEAS